VGTSRWGAPQERAKSMSAARIAASATSSGRTSAAAIRNIAWYDSKYPIKPMSPVAISDPAEAKR